MAFFDMCTLMQTMPISNTKTKQDLFLFIDIYVHKYVDIYANNCEFTHLNYIHTDYPNVKEKLHSTKRVMQKKQQTSSITLHRRIIINLLGIVSSALLID
jgi:hypothetical protein